MDGLIMVDFQYDFVEPGGPLSVPGGPDALVKSRLVLDEFRKRNHPVYFTRSAYAPDGHDVSYSAVTFTAIGRGTVLVEGTRGAEIVEDVKPRPGEVVITKHRYSPFFQTSLESMLHRDGVDRVVICGLTTENCCHATARDAMFLGHPVSIVADATAALPYKSINGGMISAEEVHAVTLSILRGSTASVVESAEAVELLGP